MERCQLLWPALLLHFAPFQSAESELDASTTLTLDGDSRVEQLAPVHNKSPVITAELSTFPEWVFLTALERRVESGEDTWLLLQKRRYEGRDDCVQQGPLKAHPLSKFPALWWSLKHAHTDTTVTPKSHTLMHTHIACLLKFYRGLGGALLQSLSSPATTAPTHTGHRYSSQLYGLCGFQ